uniref:Uncharacterized protein n=1 Tax=Cannabis sativa TaxID=3483 RepID=A0A803NTD4_CANSA
MGRCRQCRSVWIKVVVFPMKAFNESNVHRIEEWKECDRSYPKNNNCMWLSGNARMLVALPKNKYYGWKAHKVRGRKHWIYFKFEKIPLLYYRCGIGPRLGWERRSSEGRLSNGRGEDQELLKLKVGITMNIISKILGMITRKEWGHIMIREKVANNKKSPIRVQNQSWGVESIKVASVTGSKRKEEGVGELIDERKRKDEVALSGKKEIKKSRWIRKEGRIAEGWWISILVAGSPRSKTPFKEKLRKELWSPTLCGGPGNVNGCGVLAHEWKADSVVIGSTSCKCSWVYLCFLISDGEERRFSWLGCCEKSIPDLHKKGGFRKEKERNDGGFSEKPTNQQETVSQQNQQEQSNNTTTMPIMSDRMIKRMHFQHGGGHCRGFVMVTASWAVEAQDQGLLYQAREHYAATVIQTAFRGIWPIQVRSASPVVGEKTKLPHILSNQALRSNYYYNGRVGSTTSTASGRDLLTEREREVGLMLKRLSPVPDPYGGGMVYGRGLWP